MTTPSLPPSFSVSFGKDAKVKNDVLKINSDLVVDFKKTVDLHDAFPLPAIEHSLNK